MRSRLQQLQQLLTKRSIPYLDGAYREHGDLNLVRPFSFVSVNWLPTPQYLFYTTLSILWMINYDLWWERRVLTPLPSANGDSAAVRKPVSLLKEPENHRGLNAGTNRKSGSQMRKLIS